MNDRRPILAAAGVAAALLAACGETEPATAADVTDAGDAMCMAEAGMAEIPGGAFVMGSDAYYPEEGPTRGAEVAPFRIDRHEVTNVQFAEFVDATGYVTVAERTPDPVEFPGIDPAALVPGSAVFVAAEREAEAGRWAFVPGASWRAPQGPGSSIDGKETYPVVHVAYEDAATSAAWRGARLPTEAVWERAARAGREGATYEWGAELAPEDEWRANTWQGVFPLSDRGEDGFIGAAPVGCYEASDYGLYDMTGNVWEWTADAWPGDPASGVVKGGSFLCAENFCARYRPAARQPYERNFSASHLGFRVAAD